MQPHWQKTMYQNYPIQDTSTLTLGVGVEDEDEIDNLLLSTWIKRIPKEIIGWQSLLPLLEIDQSSVLPHLEIKRETSLLQEKIKPLPEVPLEFDVYVRIPPKKRWTVKGSIKSISKASPHIVEPGEL
ncbi:MAG: hypothetical protein ACTSV0_04035 [Candidatus Freyarchaeota archaeon]